LAARAYDEQAVDPRNLEGALERTVRAGLFASAVLILANQAYLGLSGTFPYAIGNSLEEDAIVIKSSFDISIDIFSEAVVLTIWRLYRASTSPPR